MLQKVYMSNISPHWTEPKQQATLASVLIGEHSLYTDTLPPAMRMGRDPASLAERASMLRPTAKARGEIINVASLAVLAWSPQDLTRVFSAAAERGATVLAHDINLAIPPNAEMSIVHTALEELARSRRRAQTELGRFAGGKISGHLRGEASRVACDKIAARWALPTKEYPTDDLLAEAGVSRNTATKYLDRRPEAQRKHRLGIAQAERSRKQAFAYNGTGEHPFVYLMRRSDGSWKVGFSGNPESRARDLQGRSHGIAFKVVKTWQRQDAHRIEKMTHRILRIRLDLKSDSMETFRAPRRDIIAAIEKAISIADASYTKTKELLEKSK